MNIQVSHKPFTTTAEYLSEAKARKLRIWSARPPTALRIVEAVESVPDPAVAPQRVQPGWRKSPTYFDAHVRDYREFQFDRVANKARAHIKMRCAELQVSYTDVVGPKRFRDLVEVRHLLMWELKTKFEKNLMDIGRLFGRDHTTVLSAVTKYEEHITGAAPKGLNRYTGYTLTTDNVRQMRYLYEIGWTIRDLKRKFHIGSERFYALRDEGGWVWKARACVDNLL